MRTLAARRVRRSTTVLAAALAAFTAVIPAAQAAHKPRIAGEGRHGTAVEISKATFPAAENAIIARADDFPDALAASYLANYYQAPILLTDTGNLNAETEAELERLGVANVYLLGGEGAISLAVEAELEANYNVTRIAGDSRYTTAAAIATWAPAEDVGTLGSSGRTAIVTRAGVFADALSGGPVSYAGSFPTLLTDSDTLHPAASDALDDLAIQYVLVLGGENAISSTVASQIEAKGITIQRLAGTTRTGTAAAIADFGRTQLGFSTTEAVLARGDLFPDALAAGPYGAVEQSPILLTNTPTDLSSETTAWLQGNADSVAKVVVVGGINAVTEAVHTEASAAAGNESG